MNKGILILFRKWSLFERNVRISDALYIYKSTISLPAHKVAQRLSSYYLMNSLKEKVLLSLAMTCIFQSNIWVSARPNYSLANLAKGSILCSQMLCSVATKNTDMLVFKLSYLCFFFCM